MANERTPPENGVPPPVNTQPPADQPTPSEPPGTGAGGSQRGGTAEGPELQKKSQELPAAGLRNKSRPLWPTLLIVLILGLVGFCALRGFFHQRERIAVYFSDVHGLHAGSPLEHRGEQIGEVVEIERPTDLGKRKVIIELNDDPVIKDRLKRKGNDFFVSRFASDRMQIKGVTKVIRGPSVVVRLGNPEGESKTEFDGSDTLPPDPRVEWNSVRLTVSFYDVQGLAEGAPVMDRGQEVGVVEKVVRDLNDSDIILVTLAFFNSDAKTCPYAREGTRYFINNAKLSTRGVEGDASTVLYGPRVTAVPDPCKRNGKVE